jgi:hypothetical protein
VYMVPHATDKTGLLPSPPRRQAPGTRKSRETSLGCRPVAGVSACIATGGETITRFLRPAGAERPLLVRGIRCW